MEEGGQTIPTDPERNTNSILAASNSISVGEEPFRQVVMLHAPLASNITPNRASAPYQYMSMSELDTYPQVQAATQPFEFQGAVDPSLMFNLP